jgi:hypothetical protein
VTTNADYWAKFQGRIDEDENNARRIVGKREASTDAGCCFLAEKRICRRGKTNGPAHGETHPPVADLSKLHHPTARDMIQSSKSLN